MRVLIVGIGSIAKKHIEVLRSLESEIELYGLRSSTQSTSIDNLTDIYSWEEVPSNLDFIIISNPTSEHYASIMKAIAFKVPLFIEKPSLANLEGSENLLKEIDRHKVITYIAFPLRFNPVVGWLKANLLDKRIFELNAYCGSYLPDWRPGQDYTTTYSASRDMGGGVHLDLIHELDYVTWLLGLPLNSTSSFSKVSDLNIDSFDSAHYWLTYKDKNAAITLNYFRRDAKRELVIVMEADTWTADLLTNEVQNQRGETIFRAEPSKKSMYYEQMRYFIDSVKSGETPMNSLATSLNVLEICLLDNYER